MIENFTPVAPVWCAWRIGARYGSGLVVGWVRDADEAWRYHPVVQSGGWFAPTAITPTTYPGHLDAVEAEFLTDPEAARQRAEEMDAAAWKVRSAELDREGAEAYRRLLSEDDPTTPLPADVTGYGGSGRKMIEHLARHMRAVGAATPAEARRALEASGSRTAVYAAWQALIDLGRLQPVDPAVSTARRRWVDTP